jgi:SAM-dependent methyltransferase
MSRGGQVWTTLRPPGLAALVFVVACASTRGSGGGALEPRFVAVHNALAAMGLAQVGPIHEGALAEGREARVALQLSAGCTTLAAIGGEGVRDVDATLLDAQGHPLAHDTTNEPQAILRACVDAADAYVLVVKLASGSGTWVAATWQGGTAGDTSPGVAALNAQKAREANGTCEAPLPLAAGTVTGSTTHGEHENAGSCGPSDSRELVYELDVPQRERVTIDVEARFDSVLYLRKDDCTDANAEVDCSDDAPDRTHSRIERVLDPGKYFVFVDGYAHDAGSFKITVAMTDVLALADVCRRAPLAPLGATVAGTTAAMGNDAEASCGGGAEGADAAWRVELPSRSRVRIVEHSDEMNPVVHVRRSCADEQSELACGESSGSAGDAVLTGIFDPGTYTVFADAQDRDAGGHYSLEVEVASSSGTGASGDGCGDAIALGNSTTVSGDTFAARDDVAGSCGGAGAADLVYRVDVAKRSRLVAALQAEEASHLIVVWRRCGDRSTEIACGRDVDDVLAPGSYFVAVDGSSEDALGRFTLSFALHDLTAQGGACLSAPTLVDGKAISGTTVGAGDKFAVSCAGGDGAASGPDRAYKIVVPRRTRVHLALTAPSFNAAMALRKACADASGGARAAELVCEADSDVGQRTVIDRTVEIGTYWVVVDGQTPNDQGPFTLEYRATR